MIWVRFISVEDVAVYFVLRITYLGRLTKYAVGSTQYGHLRSAHQLI